MKTFIKDMTSEQLAKVVTENIQLQNNLYDLQCETEIFYNQEILDKLDLQDYYISIDRPSYIMENNLFTFSSGLLEAEKDFNIFGADSNNYKNRLESLLTSYDNALNDDETDKAENDLYNLTNEIKGYLIASLESGFNFDLDSTIESFKGFHFESFANHYIKNDDYTKLYIMTEISI